MARLELHLHIHLHQEDLAALVRRGFEQQQHQGELLMTIAQDISTLVSQVDARTNEIGVVVTRNAGSITEIASDLARLRDSIGPGAIPADKAAEIKAALEAATARLGTTSQSLQEQAGDLEQLGQDPEEPIPGSGDGDGGGTDPNA